MMRLEAVFQCFVCVFLILNYDLLLVEAAEFQSSNLIQVVAEKDDCLYAHNFLRRIHRAPAFTWDEDLANKAKNWTSYLASIGEIKHSNPRFQYRENIHHYWGGSEGYDIVSAIRAWYGTVRLYDFNNNKISNPMSLMFAIMMWDETTRIGCAISRNRKDNEGFVVVMYAPGVMNHGADNYKRHLHRPINLSDRDFIDSKQIRLPTFEELKRPGDDPDDLHWLTEPLYGVSMKNTSRITLH
eukprot:TCONS_00025014-protein